MRPLEQVELGKRRAVVLRERPVERERVGVAFRADDQLVHGARVPDLVLCDRGEGDVLLEHGRDAGPFGVAPAEDELVVSQAQQCLLVHEPPSGGP